ncbi:MAG: DNA gyrase/topoisomerase IV subunit A [Prevotella sp.]
MSDKTKDNGILEQDEKDYNDADAAGATDEATEDPTEDGQEADNDSEEEESGENPQAEEHVNDYKPVNRFDAAAVHHLSGMYQSWFLDYASYAILDRAVPHLEDGLKPVQRRILHSMKRMDDGRYNKVANIVGHAMQFHPHGDASIGDALVQLGQKDLLVDCQGNWGNILTGDKAAAPRYIEARLSKFALDVVFNPKTTDWQLSYDGRNKEPVTLPAKFPLLLAQGAEGIAVGLSTKTLPHNLNEICDAAISYLRRKPFVLLPDFPTGGSIDVSKYNDGQRGGVLKVRAKIEKLDSKTLVIREIPFSRTTTTLIESILKAVEKGKIKAKKVEDNTAAEVEIVVHLIPGTSPDKTIDALYAFSDCEISISPNCCVIEDNKPWFLTISDVLRHSVDRTMRLLEQELRIRRSELSEQLFYASLERIFIEKRIYKDKGFETAENMDEALAHIDTRLEPFKPALIREVTRDDLLRLMEIKMQRILKFNKDKADELIARIKAEIADIDNDLSHMTSVTVKWFSYIKEKYGKAHPRLTEVKNFDTIVASKVVDANQKLYINRKEGFMGTGLKKDEFVCNCSDLDSIIVFFRNGIFKIVRVAEKMFIGKDIIHLQVFKKNDSRTTYNVVYREGESRHYFMKRFNVTAAILDRETLFVPKPGAKVLYFTANPNGEAETVKVTLEPMPRLRNLFMEKDFAKVPIRTRSAKGLLVTKLPVCRVGLKSHGRSTLGGRLMWFDMDVKRLNCEENGQLLGEFGDGDRILVVLDNGEYYTANTDVNNHFEDNILYVEKFNAEKVWTLVTYDAAHRNDLYLKRFHMEKIIKPQSYLGENGDYRLVAITGEKNPRIRIEYTGKDADEQPLEMETADANVFKSPKPRGRRISTLRYKTVEFLPSLLPEEEEEPEDADEGENGLSGTMEAETDMESGSTGEETKTADNKNMQLDLFGEDEQQ